jgi:hypothetical protein
MWKLTLSYGSYNDKLVRLELLASPKVVSSSFLKKQSKLADEL